MVPRRGKRRTDSSDEEEEDDAYMDVAVAQPQTGRTVDISQFLSDSDSELEADSEEDYEESMSDESDPYPPQEVMYESEEEEEEAADAESDSEDSDPFDTSAVTQPPPRVSTDGQTRRKVVHVAPRGDVTLEARALKAIEAYRIDTDGRIDVLIRYLGVSSSGLVDILGWNPGRLVMPSPVRRLHRNLCREILEVLTEAGAANLDFVIEPRPIPLRDHALDQLYGQVDVIRQSHTILDYVETAFVMMDRGDLEAARERALAAFRRGMALFTKASVDVRVMTPEALAIRYRIPSGEPIRAYIWGGLAWLARATPTPDLEDAYFHDLYERIDGIWDCNARYRAAQQGMDAFEAWHNCGLRRSWFFADRDPDNAGVAVYARQLRDFYGRVMRRPEFVEALGNRRFSRIMLAHELREFCYIVPRDFCGTEWIHKWQFPAPLFDDVRAFMRRFIASFGIIPPYFLLEEMRSIVQEAEVQAPADRLEPVPTQAPVPVPVPEDEVVVVVEKKKKRPKTRPGRREHRRSRRTIDDPEPSSTLEDLLDIAADSLDMEDAMLDEYPVKGV